MIMMGDGDGDIINIVVVVVVAVLMRFSILDAVVCVVGYFSWFFSISVCVRFIVVVVVLSFCVKTCFFLLLFRSKFLSPYSQRK